MKKIILIGIILFSQNLLSQDITTIVTGVVTEKTIKNIVADAKQKATSLIADGRNAGNAAMVRMGDILNVSADNLIRLAGDEIDRIVDKKLSPDLFNLSKDVDKLVRSADSMVKELRGLKDTAALDLQSLIGNFPFTKEKLLVQKIEGLTQLKKESPYKIKLIASYVGTPSDTHNSKIELTIDGKTIKTMTLIPSGIHETTLNIPHNSIAGMFQEKSLSIKKGVLKITQKFKKRKMLFFKKWVERSYEVPFNINLYPEYAGTLKMEYGKRVYGWEQVATKSNTAWGGNNNCTGGCSDWDGNPYTVSINVPGGNIPNIVGDQRFRRVILCGCIAGTCGYDHRNSMTISNNATIASCSWQGRSHPSQWKIEAEVEQWKLIREEIRTDSIEFNWNQNNKVKIPDDVSFARLYGTLISGEKIDLLLDQTDSNNLIELNQRVDNDGYDTLYFHLSRPDGT